MIRVGLDLERIERFNFINSWSGEAFYRRVYTPAEQLAYNKDPLLLALCFSGKEAVSKVLGVGLAFGKGDEVSCQEIEILCPQALDHPEVTLKDKTLIIANSLCFCKISLHWSYNFRWVCSIAASLDDPLLAQDLQKNLKRTQQVMVDKLNTLDRSQRKRLATNNRLFSKT